jgi:hypothetical protein
MRYLKILVLICTISADYASKQIDVTEGEHLRSSYFEMLGLRYEGLGMISEALKSLKTARRLNFSYPISNHIERLENMICSVHGNKVVQLVSFIPAWFKPPSSLLIRIRL